MVHGYAVSKPVQELVHKKFVRHTQAHRHGIPRFVDVLSDSPHKIDFIHPLSSTMKNPVYQKAAWRKSGTTTSGMAMFARDSSGTERG
jgi:hypothetical protein